MTDKYWSRFVSNSLPRRSRQTHPRSGFSAPQVSSERLREAFFPLTAWVTISHRLFVIFVIDPLVNDWTKLENFNIINIYFNSRMMLYEPLTTTTHTHIYTLNAGSPWVSPVTLVRARLQEHFPARPRVTRAPPCQGLSGSKWWAWHLGRWKETDPVVWTAASWLGFDHLMNFQECFIHSWWFSPSFCAWLNLPFFILFQFYCNTVDDFLMASTWWNQWNPSIFPTETIPSTELRTATWAWRTSMWPPAAPSRSAPARTSRTAPRRSWDLGWSVDHFIPSGQ